MYECVGNLEFVRRMSDIFCSMQYQWLNTPHAITHSCTQTHQQNKQVCMELIKSRFNSLLLKNLEKAALPNSKQRLHLPCRCRYKYKC